MANKDVVRVLEGVESSKLTEDLGSYYGSILGLLDHLLASDISWLKMLGRNISELDFILPLIEEFKIERLTPKELHWKTLSEYNSIRVKVDEIIERMVTTLSPEQYLEEFTMKGRRGEFTTIVWRNLLLLFNHHIHHRGGLAVLLDQLDVQNNFSTHLMRA
jgi:uncharacterized damage-inducible protein DinB